MLPGDVAEGIRALKAKDGADLRVLGSGGLVQSLVAHDLVDEYHLMIHPLVVGRGKRLFPDGNPETPLRLLQSDCPQIALLDGQAIHVRACAAPSPGTWRLAPAEATLPGRPGAAAATATPAATKPARPMKDRLVMRDPSSINRQLFRAGSSTP